MTTKELLKQVLEQWGFPVLEEKEHSLLFRYQMNYIQLNAMDGNGDNRSVAATLSGIFTAEDEQELRLGLKTCNDLNWHLLQVKLYIDGDNDLIVASEFFYKTEEDMEHLLIMSLNALITGKKQFIKKYKEYVEEEKLLSELNEEEE
ncbi:MAG: hypothetical protein K2H47_09385 [Muribaculaceae bacterium]|nr:hypothetical protein [Muribaculaceae bacterium]